MNDIPTTIIYLTPIDAELFVKFQKYHQLFQLLVDKGVFNQKNGNVLLNFGPNGEISSIERHDILYSARHEKVIPNLT